MAETRQKEWQKCDKVPMKWNRHTAALYINYKIEKKTWTTELHCRRLPTSKLTAVRARHNTLRYRTRRYFKRKPLTAEQLLCMLHHQSSNHDCTRKDETAYWKYPREVKPWQFNETNCNSDDGSKFSKSQFNWWRNRQDNQSGHRIAQSRSLIQIRPKTSAVTF